MKDLLAEQKIGNYRVISIYDKQPDVKYIDESAYLSCNGNRYKFAFQAIKSSVNADIIVLSHINLLIFGWIIKKINPKKKIILFAHGIEIWTQLTNWKTNFIRKHVDILAVSNFTAKKIEEIHKIQPQNITIINNTVGPFFNIPVTFEKPRELIERYQLKTENQVLFTLTRLSSKEQYKGYDKVIEVLSELPENIKYVLAGKADDEEINRLKNLISSKNLQNRVILTGFLPEAEITNHYLLADVFVMPSKGEGFGISFIEAAACGRRSIVGNQDGSVDAILNGELGQTVSPEDKAALKSAILQELASAKTQELNLQKTCLNAFGFEAYRAKVETALSKYKITHSATSPSRAETSSYRNNGA